MRKKLMMLILLCAAMVPAAAQEDQSHILIKKVDGTVDSLLLNNVRDIYHSRRDVNGVEQQDISTLRLRTLGAECVYPLKEIDYVVMPNHGRYISFLGTTSTDDGQGGSNRTSVYSDDFLDKNQPVSYRWVSNDRIYLSTGDRSENVRINSDSRVGSFTFRSDTLTADTYIVYYPGTQTDAFNKVIIPTVQEQKIPNNSDHLGASGDCGTATATRQANSSYSFSLDHKTAVLCFIPRVDSLETIRLKHIAVKSTDGKMLGGTYTLSTDGLSLVDETGSDTLTLKTSDFILPHNKQKPANADWEYIPQDTVASYMVIAPQSERTPLKVYYRVYDTKSGIDTVIVKSSAINNQVKGATVYPVTHIIPVRAFFSAFTDSCKWSFGNPAQLYGSVNLPITHYGFIWGYNRNLTFATKEAQMSLDNYPTLTFNGTAVNDVKQKAYFYRAYAQEGDKTWFGKVKKFGMDREIIDLGTSVRWSSINMGAVTAEDRGKYYAWGELTTKDTYTEGNYAYYNGPGQPYTDIGKDIAGLPAYDVVAKEWRGCWRMPTHAELVELYTTTRKNVTRVNEDGESINGYLFTGKGDDPDSIFVPKAGYITSGPNSVNSSFLYWSSTEYNNKYGYRAYDNDANSTAQKYMGFPIRPVFDSNIETVDGKYLFIRTDSISYSADHTETDMYGTMRGLDDVVTDVTKGFVIGTAEDVTLESSTEVLKVTLTAQEVGDNGSYSLPLSKEQMNTLDVTSTYYVRAYLTYNDYTWYGDPKEMQAMTIQTDSTNWQVGMTEARLCGAVTGVTEAVQGTTEIGFVVGTVADVNLDMPEEQRIKIKCNTTDNGKFVCNFTNIGFNQYYYRAYVNVGGRIAYGDPKMLGLEFVDLDLPSGLKWANINVGSQTPMDNGGFYSWGETKTKSNYSQGYYSSEGATMSDIGGTIYDAAQVNWQGPWRMPSKSDVQELLANCTQKHTTMYGKEGFLLTGKNGKSIFIPEAGYMSGTTNYDSTWRALLWTSTKYSDNGDRTAWYFDNYNDHNKLQLINNDWLRDGMSVRPVAMVNNTLDDESMIQMTTDSVQWEVGQTSAKLYGYLLGLRYNSNATESGFAYATTPNVTDQTSGVQYLKTNEGELYNVASGVFSATVSELEDETVYYYRAYVKVDGKYYFGNEREFGRRTVDLGLGNGVMWSNINLGASSSDDSGDYYAWGETTPKTSFNKPATYPDLGADIAGSSHDAATTAGHWGGLWRMPTRDDVNDLITKCTWTEVTKYDQPMYKIVGPSGDSIFIAKRGSMNGTAVARDGERVMMWTSNLNTTDAYNHENAYGTSFYGTNRTIDAVARYLGYTIRPVIKYNKQHEQTKFYLTTDSTNWQVGVTDVRLVGAVAGLAKLDTATNVTVTRGFVVGCDSTSTALVAGGTDVTDITATASATDNTFRGTLTYAKDTTYYYRAYVKIDDTYYYGNTRRYGLELVDMGNGIKWASINLGAQTSSEYGDRYAWGETTSKTTYTQASYTHYDNGYKYLGADISNKASYDAVKANWTGSWRMPTNAEMQWLVENCDWVWTTEDGIAGYRVTSQTQNDKGGYNSIFLPAAGYQTGGYYQEIGSGCHYWTSVYYNDGDSYALIGNQAGDSVTAEHRYYGVSVRAVTTAGANEGGGGDITGGHNQGGSQGTGGDGNGSGNAGSGDTGGTIGN